MVIHLCVTCGTSYASSAAPPDRCAICDDERQYVPPRGQRWIFRDALAIGHANSWRGHEPGLFSIVTTPRFAIGQRAFLIVTPAGNILWDCIANLDDATRQIIDALGGIHAIAVSHPHYYTTMQDWADAFAAPVFVHAADRDWVMRESPRLRFWEGETHDLLPGIRLHRLGGHFAGGSVLHWVAQGTLLVGDIVQVAPGCDRVSFLWSYPNMLPLPAVSVTAIAARIGAIDFDRVHGAFDGQDISQGAKAIILASARQYLTCLQTERA